MVSDHPWDQEDVVLCDSLNFEGLIVHNIELRDENTLSHNQGSPKIEGPLRNNNLKQHIEGYMEHEKSMWKNLTLVSFK